MLTRQFVEILVVFIPKTVRADQSTGFGIPDIIQLTPVFFEAYLTEIP